jgi:hypothetical protein
MRSRKSIQDAITRHVIKSVECGSSNHDKNATYTKAVHSPCWSCCVKPGNIPEGTLIDSALSFFDKEISKLEVDSSHMKLSSLPCVQVIDSESYLSDDSLMIIIVCSFTVEVYYNE